VNSPSSDEEDQEGDRISLFEEKQLVELRMSPSSVEIPTKGRGEEEQGEDNEFR
jgi:hypothetical protein